MQPRFAISLLFGAGLLALLNTGGPLQAGDVEPVEYVRTVYPPLGGTFSRINALNSLGQGAGAAQDAQGRTWACLFANGQTHALGALPGHTQSIAYGINNIGWTCGQSLLTPSSGTAFVFVPDVMNGTTGSLLALPGLGGARSFASAINNFNWISGWAESATGQMTAVTWGPSTPLGTDYSIYPLGPLLNGATSAARDINDSRSMTGDGNTASGQVVYRWTPTFPGSTSWVQTVLPRPRGSTTVSAQEIDEKHTILLCTSTNTRPGVFAIRSYLQYFGTTTFVSLPLDRGMPTVFMSGRDASGVTVGTNYSNSNGTAIIHRDGKPTFTTIQASDLPNIETAPVISDTGAIGVNARPAGQPRAAILEPKGLKLQKSYRHIDAEDLRAFVIGDIVVFELQVKNESGEALRNVEISDTFYRGYRLIGGKSVQIPATIRQTQLPNQAIRFTAHFNEIPAGASTTIVILCKSVEAPDEVFHTNTAHAEAEGVHAISNRILPQFLSVREAEEIEEKLEKSGLNRYLATLTNGGTPDDDSEEVQAQALVIPKPALPGPFYLILDNLQNATLVGATKVTTRLGPLGSPYIKLNTRSLPSGKSIKATVRFRPDADGGPITFTARVAHGPGAP